jgi:hypothetical protein
LRNLEESAASTIGSSSAQEAEGLLLMRITYFQDALFAKHILSGDQMNP